MGSTQWYFRKALHELANAPERSEYRKTLHADHLQTLKEHKNMVDIEGLYPRLWSTDYLLTQIGIFSFGFFSHFAEFRFLPPFLFGTSWGLARQYLTQGRKNLVSLFRSTLPTAAKAGFGID